MHQTPTLDFLAQHLAKDETHRQILGDYDGMYGLCIGVSPENPNQYIYKLKVRKNVNKKFSPYVLLGADEMKVPVQTVYEI